MTEAEKNRRELVKQCCIGKGTPKQIEYYRAKSMSPEEVVFGKPVFEMNMREFLEFCVLSENMKQGNLPYGNCPKCKNKGYIVGLDEEGNEYMEDCSCMEKRKNMQQLEDSEYSALLRKCTFERFNLKELWQKEALRKCKEWTQQTRFPLLYLGGKTGAGKTHLAVAAFRVAIMRGLRGKFISWRTMSRDLKMNMTSPDYERKMWSLKKMPLLLLDDFFWSPKGAIPSDEDFRLAKEIIDARFYNGRKTIITSNFTAQDIYTMSEEMSGRLNEFSGGDKNFMLTFGNEIANYRYNIALEKIEDDDCPF